MDTWISKTACPIPRWSDSIYQCLARSTAATEHFLRPFYRNISPYNFRSKISANNLISEKEEPICSHRNCVHLRIIRQRRVAIIGCNWNCHPKNVLWHKIIRIWTTLLVSEKHQRIHFHYAELLTNRTSSFDSSTVCILCCTQPAVLHAPEPRWQWFNGPNGCVWMQIPWIEVRWFLVPSPADGLQPATTSVWEYYTWWCQKMRT